MTRLALRSIIPLLLAAAIGYGMGAEDVARSSGLYAPELSEPPVAPFVNGRPAVAPDWSAVLPYGAWNGCWDCPTNDKPLTDEKAPPVPLPGAVWAAATAIAALAALKWRTR